MAKMKTFVVEVEVTTKLMLFVEARKPDGARARIQSNDGWRHATAYHDDDCIPPWYNPNTMKITDVREANI